jgi:hypothetical protein
MVTDKGGGLWIGEEWGTRSGHIKGEWTVYYTHHLPSNKDVMFREREETPSKVGYTVYARAGWNMSLPYAAVWPSEWINLVWALLIVCEFLLCLFRTKQNATIVFNNVWVATVVAGCSLVNEIRRQVETRQNYLTHWKEFTNLTEQIGKLFGPEQRVHSDRTPDHCDWPWIKEIFDYVQTQWA